LGGTTNFFLWYRIPIPPYGNTFVAVGGLIFLYAILRHRLLDIEIVIRKSFIYTTLIGLITTLYVFAVFITERLFGQVLGYKSLFVNIITVLLIAILFQPLKNKIQLFVDKYFFKGSQEALQRENDRLMVELQRTDRLKAVATMAAGMAHEIKNPLSSIKTFSEYLPIKYNDKDYRDKFTKIVSTEVDKINKIVQDLLDFSKPKPIEPKLTDIPKLLDNTIDLLSNELIHRNIDIIRQFDPDTPQITADPNKLKQAFLNLFLNSIDAINAKGTITVSTKQQDNYLLIQIQDTGKGIPQNDISKIFDPFYTTKEHGTGLGLSIVHGIVVEHKGEIFVESKPGQGACFIIKLPV